MNYLELLQQIFEVCIIPLLGVLTTFLVKFINNKSSEIKSKTENELIINYINLLNNTISECVIATNQTYVNYLKQEGKFDINAQKEAFRLTYEAVLNILNEESKIYLKQAFGDLTNYIKQQIEDEVNLHK